MIFACVSQYNQEVFFITLEQFKRMKPKYRIRLVLTGVAFLLLLFLLLRGLSCGVSAIRTQVNTKTLDGITSENVLKKESMMAIASAVGRQGDDLSGMIVTGSELVMQGTGKVISLKMDFVIFTGEHSSENWKLVSDEKKTTLQKVAAKNEGQRHLDNISLPFNIYYPGLSRAVTTPTLLSKMKQHADVGDLGYYIFKDNFDIKQPPDFQSKMHDDMVAIWVPKVGDITFALESTYQPTNKCVPTVVTIKPMDQQLTTDRKVVYQEEKEQFVVLLEASTYS